MSFLCLKLFFFKYKKKFSIKYKTNYKYLVLFHLILFSILILNFKTTIKRIGVISLPSHENIGNNLLKYAIYIKLLQFGYKPQIIGKQYDKTNISFIKKTINIKIIKSFTEINKNDYDILMVNSDQTWRRWGNDFFDVAFLNFSKNWNIHKFVYGASLGIDKWKFSRNELLTAKNLLKNFTDISVREKSSIEINIRKVRDKTKVCIRSNMAYR